MIRVNPLAAIAAGILMTCWSANAQTTGAAAAPTWPSQTKGLVFRTTDKPNSPFQAWKADGTKVPGMEVELVTEGLAVYARGGAFRLEGGAFVGKKLGGILAGAIRAANEFTIEAAISPAARSQPGPACVFALAEDEESAQVALALVQRDHRLGLQLRSGKYAGLAPLLDLADDSPFHLIVSYRPGALAAWKDGKQVLTSGEPKHDLGECSDYCRLSFGNDAQGVSPWRGLLEGVAVFARALEADEAAAEFKARQAVVKARTPVPVVRVQAKLTAKSSFQTPEQDPGYRNAYAVNEYEVEKVLDGVLKDKKIRVAQWVWVGRTLVRASDLSVGRSCEMVLEPLSDNPAVEQERTFDDTDGGADSPVFYDAGKIEPVTTRRTQQ